jgi:polyphosphate kinase 2 (PPK2 family)
VVTVRVRERVPESVWRPRFCHIREFECLLADEGTMLVKVFLHISAEEQRERFAKRLENPEKR